MEGACEANGVFSRHIIHHLTTPPSLWADKQDQLLESMGPESEFQRRMVDTAKLHTSIDVHFSLLRLSSFLKICWTTFRSTLLSSRGEWWGCAKMQQGSLQ